MKTERTYILLNKPIGYVTTMKDDRGRPIAADLLHGIHQRVYPVGRLDMYSEGLLIFTDDGELANRMMHPSHDMDKEYILSLKGEFTENDVHRYTLPMELDGYRLRPVQAHLLGTHVHHDGQICTDISVTLHEGRNRQIRKMSEQLGYKVVSLKRVRVGEIQLGTLPCGRWRYLTESEIEYLKTI